MEGNKEIALSLIETLNVRDLDLWSRHLAEDYAAEHPGVFVPLDKTRTISYHQRFVTAVPDIRFEVLGVVSEGDSVLVQWTASGTTPKGGPPSRGRPSPRPDGGLRYRERWLPRRGTARWYAGGSIGTSSRSCPSWA